MPDSRRCNLKHLWPFQVGCRWMVDLPLALLVPLALRVTATGRPPSLLLVTHWHCLPVETQHIIFNFQCYGTSLCFACQAWVPIVWNLNTMLQFSNTMGLHFASHLKSVSHSMELSSAISHTMGNSIYTKLAFPIVWDNKCHDIP